MGKKSSEAPSRNSEPLHNNDPPVHFGWSAFDHPRIKKEPDEAELFPRDNEADSNGEIDPDGEGSTDRELRAKTNNRKISTQMKSNKKSKPIAEPPKRTRNVNPNVAKLTDEESQAMLAQPVFHSALFKELEKLSVGEVVKLDGEISPIKISFYGYNA